MKSVTSCKAIQGPRNSITIIRHYTATVKKFLAHHILYIIWLLQYRGHTLEGQKKIIHVSKIGTPGTFLSPHLLKHSKPLIQQYHAQRDQGIYESSSGSKHVLGATCTHITLTLYWPDYIGGQSFRLTIHPSDAYEYRTRDGQEFCGSMYIISQCCNNYIVI